MNRRQFIAGVGAFFILPGAGRLWKATRSDPVCMVRFREGEEIQSLRVSEMDSEQKRLLHEHRARVVDLFGIAPSSINGFLHADIPALGGYWRKYGPQVERVGVWGWS